MEDTWTASSPGVGLNKYTGETAEQDAYQAAKVLMATGHPADIHHWEDGAWVLADQFVPVWALEFSAHSIGQAIDIVRQHTPAGQMVAPVQEAGRCGYEVRSASYEWLSALRDDIADAGGTTILEVVS
jgi:hypothetical protein